MRAGLAGGAEEVVGADGLAAGEHPVHQGGEPGVRQSGPAVGGLRHEQADGFAALAHHPQHLVVGADQAGLPVVHADGDRQLAESPFAQFPVAGGGGFGGGVRVGGDGGFGGDRPGGAGGGVQRGGAQVGGDGAAVPVEQGEPAVPLGAAGECAQRRGGRRGGEQVSGGEAESLFGAVAEQASGAGAPGGQPAVGADDGRSVPRRGAAITLR
ncbi:hypothetical protein GCM10009663_36770 [Kitasatospora arboriphila]|uniref:Uncharacterized protein n=1 Tax=Kitasatospora arboriphila TaxID=258052 RepID=A0ABN1TIN0_9ACTN